MIAAIRRRAEPPPTLLAYREQAEQLAALIGECEVAGIGRSACVVHLSRLGPDRVLPHHLRLARAALEPLAHADRARLFTLPSLDMVAIWRGPAEVARDTSRTAIMHLFVDDDGLVSPETIWEELDLPREAARLLTLARGEAEPAPAPLPAKAAPPLDPRSLALLEAHLVRADMARFARRSQVCNRQANGTMALAWEKRTLCIEEVAESLAPGLAPRGDLWLFRRLTRRSTGGCWRCWRRRRSLNVPARSRSISMSHRYWRLSFSASTQPCRRFCAVR